MPSGPEAPCVTCSALCLPVLQGTTRSMSWNTSNRVFPCVSRPDMGVLYPWILPFHEGGLEMLCFISFHFISRHWASPRASSTSEMRQNRPGHSPIPCKQHTVTFLYLSLRKRHKKAPVQKNHQKIT